MTRSWPSFVRADAAVWLDDWDQSGEVRSQDAREMLAAWAADECELGHGRAALARVAQVAARESGVGLGAARSFVANLRSFLAAQGYHF